ncbi:FAD-dependent monooxygenase [Vibrio sp. F13]|uniref:FAD-dependent monooxygenase n=1 Tax=Vibrio sp. F13 TaxID=2070777 RepID=UPI0010BD5555|nr:FAD-dependent monooxygenase [Vibrio sp. F13]TKG06068.1 monooxygenase [Vibrio sp. F13]
MRVLIVGAGIAGCALYRRLNRLDFDLDIVEKSSKLGSEGAAICLPANAMLALKSLGLSRQILDKAYKVEQIEYALSSGKTLAKASLTEPPLDIAPFVALKRDALMSVLRHGMADNVQLSTWPISLEQHRDTATVTFNTGKMKDYDLVIGADGINSFVRELVQPGAPLLEHQVTNWRFIAQNLSGTTNPIYYIDDNSVFMIYPISKHEVYCYGQVGDKSRLYAQMSSLEAMRSLFSDYAQPVRDCIGSLTDASQIVSGQLKSVQKTESVFNRVVLVGDALHGCPPSLQQGAGLSLEDVNCLADLLENTPLEVALEEYKEKRKRRISWVVKESNKLIKLAGLGRSSIGRFVRNSIIRLKGPANVVGWRKLLREDQ